MGHAREELEVRCTPAMGGMPAISPADSISIAGSRIVSTVLSGCTEDVAVRLWDGRLAHGHYNARCTIVFNEPDALRELVLKRNILRLAEDFISGAIDVEGDLEYLFNLGTFLAGMSHPLTVLLRLLFLTLQLPSQPRGIPVTRSNRAGRRNSQSSIAHHYDVGNDFYRLWLDPEMVYSCAYFRNTDQTLEQAQRDKLDYLCRKLRLGPGHRLLDIGCGWGALALWAARHYGVKVHGITLSEAQAQLAGERIRAAGLQDRAHVELRDYRDLQGEACYDRVVSVGMFEHIGIDNYPLYFTTVRRLLKPQGLFLNHGITSESGWQDTSLTRFMNRYIFPDGELSRISDVTDAMERAGFEILDVECLRRHYALTLRQWVSRLEQAYEEAAQSTSESTCRLWRLYMAGCAHFFDEGSIGVHQVLAGLQHQPHPVPLRRDDIYTTGNR